MKYLKKFFEQQHEKSDEEKNDDWWISQEPDSKTPEILGNDDLFASKYDYEGDDDGDPDDYYDDDDYDDEDDYDEDYDDDGRVGIQIPPYVNPFGSLPVPDPRTDLIEDLFHAMYYDDDPKNDNSNYSHLESLSDEELQILKKQYLD